MRNIAIVGAHSANKLDAPYGDSNWEIWSCSPKNENELPRVDVWFEMHKRFLSDPDADGVEYGNWLRSRSVVYMLAVSPHVRGSIAYPKDRMVERFGRYFFSSTVAWMVARAISKGPQSIGFWGIQSSAGEYAAQRPALLHFAQLADMFGIKVIAPDSGLLEPEMLYGYDHLR